MNWYEIWFDSPYYDILYGSRDEKEAQEFIKTITQKISIPADSKVLDLACGSGRFSYQLYLEHFETVGMDLSTNSIAKAKQKYGHIPIRFLEHDMLLPFPETNFDVVFNFFTSFGYFGRQEMQRVLDNIYQSLLPSGLIFIDYLNVSKILPHLPSHQTIQRQGIDFEINKTTEHEFLVKKIVVNDHIQHATKHFEEKVYMLDESHFRALLDSSHFTVLDTFGDYNLCPFDQATSERLILLARKV